MYNTYGYDTKSMDLEMETKRQGNVRSYYDILCVKFGSPHKINRSDKPADPRILQGKTKMNMYENKTVT